jgi:hypothetical protein
VENCHLYGTEYDAISLMNGYATKVIGNYVENFGLLNTNGGPGAGFSSASSSRRFWTPEAASSRTTR